ncbi:cytochrome P450 [Pseudohalocynthiibacter aestuariivivens]|uniref:Cytochrome P450 n=1 Tax=Pseudohalocynthiibacter aestuariivivens TaxID=1591409 RepID=A0ABV5JKI3_9RHOB|nr:cytochrome P450 [Pseudohalocynthiibacter aestuariivivens]MCK0101712.1 cytochrome P450 [Pseudohalocynthiibacter sp. F2068]
MQRFSQSPTDAAFVQNPYAFYERGRAAGELIWWDDYSLPCATSYDAVNALLRDRRFGREIPQDKRPEIPQHLEPFYAVEAHSMLELEGARHTRLRSLVLRAFTSRRIQTLAPEIETLCHQLIDVFPAEEFDLLPQFAQKLPVIVICRLLGIPEEMGSELLRWSNAMVTMYQARRTREDEFAAVAATEAFVSFMRSYVEERRKSPRDDLITSLIAAEEVGQKLTTDELITTCILLLNAGHEATVHTLGNGVKALLEHNTRSDAYSSENIERTVEEILRFDPPLHMFTRWAYEDAEELFGHSFKAGDEVGLLLASANRDDAAFENAARFDVSRAVKPHTSFGAGVHFCVGAPLARLELQIAIPILFSRCPQLTMTEPALYANLYHFHGLKTLMVSR